MRIFILLMLAAVVAYAQDDCNCPHANPTTVELSRAISKDLFELNGVPFMRPLVEALNSTSNSRFFSTAYVPAKVDKPYFRVSINGMAGKVTDAMKTYSPKLPEEEFNFTTILSSGWVQVNIVTGQITKLDTAKLIHYIFKTMIYDGIHGVNDTSGKPLLIEDKIRTPEKAATILGKDEAGFYLNPYTLEVVAKNRIDLLNKEFPFPGGLINQTLRDTILSTMTKLPQYFSLPKGADYSYLFAGIPQVEIGALWGTEALIRFVPAMNLGASIGDFSFYGFGLKHSLSQYFNDPKQFNLAIQAVYQGTSLTNEVGATNSALSAKAQIMNFNIQASKSVGDWLEFYTGLSYDMINIESKFTYYLSQEIQRTIGLLYLDPRWTLPETDPNYIKAPDKSYPDPANGYPGDTKPQATSLTLKDNSIKFILGANFRVFDQLSISIDANISKVNILSMGIAYQF